MARTTTTTARRYAEAAFEIAQRDGTVTAWLGQLERIAGALADDSVVRRLEDPHVPFEERHAAFRQLFTSEPMLPQVWNLLGLVLRRRRLDSVAGIAREFRRLYNRQAGITEAVATSATELDERDVTALRSRLEGMTGGRIELTLRVDPQLLGGVQVRLGDLLIDGSVRGRLARLSSRLESGSLTA
jgi:F-type H+-transporting ATPase subunit delta